MDHAVYSIEKVRGAVERAVALGAPQAEAERSAAQALGITVEAVREVVETASEVTA